uniref:class II fructose-bisphosphate aldolase n=1 Tax=Acinetobacter baumannii TaxID=470 RepID=UPI0014882C99
HGVRRINIDTDCRLASTGGIRRFMAENTAESDPRRYFATTGDSMKQMCLDSYEAFVTAGNAVKIRPISLV